MSIFGGERDRFVAERVKYFSPLVPIDSVLAHIKR